MILAASLNLLRTLRSLPVAAVVLSCLMVVSQTACLAADWNQWGGSQERNMSSQERGLPTRFEPGKRRRDRIGIDTASTQNVRWVARLGSKNYSSATVADGRVYIGTNDDSLDDPLMKQQNQSYDQPPHNHRLTLQRSLYEPDGQRSLSLHAHHNHPHYL